MLRALQGAAAGGGQGANTCDRCATDVGSRRCTWIHRRAAPAGPAWPCEGVCATLDALLQSLLFRASARARGWFRPGARGHLGAPPAPVSAHQCWGGYRVALPAEVAGVWEVGGWQPGAEMAEPEVVPPLAKAVPEL